MPQKIQLKRLLCEKNRNDIKVRKHRTYSPSKNVPSITGEPNSKSTLVKAFSISAEVLESRQLLSFPMSEQLRFLPRTLKIINH